MAKLQIETEGFEKRVIELQPGINRLGRSAENDVILDHLSVSATHCEVFLGCGPMAVRDCASTNGTFVDGSPVQDSTLVAGQTLRLGELKLRILDADVPISIPKFEVPVLDIPPVLFPDGTLSCKAHRLKSATWQCSHCLEPLCDECIHRLRRRGGKTLCLCSRCSYPVQRIGGPIQEKKSLFSRLRETTRLFLNRVLHPSLRTNNPFP